MVDAMFQEFYSYLYKLGSQSEQERELPNVPEPAPVIHQTSHALQQGYPPQQPYGGYGGAYGGYPAGPAPTSAYGAYGAPPPGGAYGGYGGYGAPPPAYGRAPLPAYGEYDVPARAQEFVITVEKNYNGRRFDNLGIEIFTGTVSRLLLKIAKIHDGSVFEAWNMDNPEKKVGAGDRIVAVDREYGYCSELVRKLQTAWQSGASVDLTIKKGTTEADRNEALRSVPGYEQYCKTQKNGQVFVTMYEFSSTEDEELLEYLSGCDEASKSWKFYAASFYLKAYDAVKDPFGVYHAGLITTYQSMTKEYSYGLRPARSTFLVQGKGVSVHEPLQLDLKLARIEDCGVSRFANVPEALKTLVQDPTSKWGPKDYEKLSWNCQTFVATSLMALFDDKDKVNKLDLPLTIGSRWAAEREYWRLREAQSPVVARVDGMGFYGQHGGAIRPGALGLHQGHRRLPTRPATQQHGQVQQHQQQEQRPYVQQQFPCAQQPGGRAGAQPRGQQRGHWQLPGPAEHSFFAPVARGETASLPMCYGGATVVPTPFAAPTFLPFGVMGSPTVVLCTSDEEYNTLESLYGTTNVNREAPLPEHHKEYLKNAIPLLAKWHRYAWYVAEEWREAMKALREEKADLLHAAAKGAQGAATKCWIVDWKKDPAAQKNEEVEAEATALEDDAPVDTNEVQIILEGDDTAEPDRSNLAGNEAKRMRLKQFKERLAQLPPRSNGHH